MSANDDLNKRVASRIQGELLAILPEDEIRLRVDAVIEDFFKPGVVTSYNNSKSFTPSKFEAIVVKELEQIATKVVSTLFNTEAWRIKVNEDLTFTIGVALQKALGIDPDVLKNVTSEVIARQRATYLATILGNSIAQYTNNHEIGNLYYSAVSNEYNRVFNGR